MPRTALIHCNAGIDYGMGHLMRCVGVAEEAVRQGWRVVIGGDLDASATRIVSRFAPASEVYVSSGAPIGAWLARTTALLAPDVLHLDTYWLEDADLPGGVPLVSNMQDDLFGRRPADLAIDGNLGADRWFAPATGRPPAILGTAGAVIRRQVLEHRTLAPRDLGPARVLIVLGGTDPHGLTARCVRAIGRITLAIDVTIICRPEQRAEIEAAASSTPHPMTILPFTDDLPELAAEQDLIVSAAGTSVWDFACMGVPMALVCAAENQRSGYNAAVAAELAVPLGAAPYDDLDDRVAAVEDFLRDPAARAAARARLMETVDGFGSWRIVSSWEQLLDAPRNLGTHPALLRPAAPTDTAMLLDWRNDEATRSASRSQRTVDLESHQNWLLRTLEGKDRRLYIAEHDNEPVGTVRWDARGDSWEVSITVAPRARGRGLAAPILAAAEDALGVAHPTRALAVVHERNYASRRLFARAGYLPHLPADEEGFATFAKWLFPR